MHVVVVDAVYVDWGTPAAQAIRCIAPEQLARFEFAAGSMAPKVTAAIDFVQHTGKRAAIGALTDLAAVLQGEAGTIIQPHMQ